MRTSVTTLHLLIAFAAACAAGEQRERRAADTAGRKAARAIPTADTTGGSAGDTIVGARVDTVPAPQSAVRKRIVNPPPPILPADTVLRADPTGAPHVPLIFPHACEGEDCVDTFRAVACRGVQLRVAPSDSSVVVAELLRGDSVEITRRDLHLLRAGRVIVRRPITIDHDIFDGPEGDETRPRADTVHFSPGDTVYLLAYAGMGSWSWWHHGKSESTDQFFAVPDDDWLGRPQRIDADSRAIALSKPRTADWWLVTPKAGGTGWWRNDGSWSLRPSAHSFDAPPCPPSDSATQR